MKDEDPGHSLTFSDVLDKFLLMNVKVQHGFHVEQLGIEIIDHLGHLVYFAIVDRFSDLDPL